VQAHLQQLDVTIHTHMARGYRNLYDIPVVYRQAQATLLELHKDGNFDIVHCQGLSALFAPKQLHDRLVVTLHGNNIYRGIVLVRYAFRDMSGSSGVTNLIDDATGSLAYWALESRACTLAKKVICLTETERHLLNHYYSQPWRKISVVPNPVMLPESKKVYPLPIPEESRVILTVSSLTLLKGIPHVVRLAKRVLSLKRDVAYVIVGSGPLVNMVAQLSRKFPKRVLYVPHVSEEITSIYSKASLLVHASLYESQGLTIAEAMLSEKPVVAFGTPSIAECVVNGVTGLLARPYETDDLTKKTCDVIDDGDAATIMGLLGKQRAQKLYDPISIARRIEQVYIEALAN
jgi:glycosyltransferase involved in cell wall biosynthesis